MQLALSGKVIGLANKECIICLGRLFLDKANACLTKIVPLDSEHNAIYQLIKNKKLDSIKKYTITASGGNFYNYSYQDLKKITRDEGVALVKKFDEEFPQKYFKDFLDYIDITEDYFWKCINKFRSPHLWHLDEKDNKWKLINTII